MRSKPSEKTHEPAAELNQVIVSGYIASQVHVYAPNRYVFTLRNQRGWFYVQWLQPTWKPRLGQSVLVQGSIYSVLCKSGNATRIRAESVVQLQSEVEVG
jgi:hypothetical protein